MNTFKLSKNYHHLLSFILHTIDHWHFGVDDTGNIFSRKNLDGLADKLKKHGGAHFVTAGEKRPITELSTEI